ncbi:rubredoxin [Oceanirhabdus seepicola]|uniref:Rubredoxin n=1 Tax=Oceanirhabdus seepicola TaxID=2828781 RepID=A0A9J6P5A7_9CLOT|nr:rubredoxin [Oceanirhabdus seepicola]MCM1992002.1 rubredoxin [Oceanirhabdus seepicola]
MDSYICSVCGFLYDPENGDINSCIDEGTEFDEIPYDWVCPHCGSLKEAFEIVY